MFDSGLNALKRLGARRWTFGFTVLFLALTALHLFLQARSYSPFFSDDGFISLRYTQRLLDGRGLTWDDYERVEGYSNLLWVLLCAVPGLLGVSLVTGARWLGHLSLTAVFGALLFGARPRQVADGVAPLVAALVLGATDAIAVWAWGGLEAPLGAACLIWGVVWALRARERATEGGSARALTWCAALAFGCCSWTRPDGPLFALTVGAALVLTGGRSAWRVAAAVIAGGLGFAVLQLGFRWFYYADIYPNTYYAKLVLNERRTQQGFEYLEQALPPLAWSWVTLASTVFLLRERTTRTLACVTLVTAVAWTAYVVRIGGDIFPAWRHFLPTCALGALILTVWLARLARGQAWAALSQVGALAFVLAIVGTHADKRNWAKEERWEWDGVPIAKLLRKSFASERPLLAIEPAGSIPFFSQLPALDLLGLSDRYLAHHRPADMGQRWLGHELGDASYYARRKPDLVCFYTPPCRRDSIFPEQRKWAGSPEFRAGYDLSFVEARGGSEPLVSELWVRRSGRVGFVASADRLSVPPLLLGISKKSPVVPHGKGLAVRAPARAALQVSRLSLLPGHWRVEVNAPGALARLEVKQGSTSLGACTECKTFDFELGAEGEVDLSLRADSKGALIEGVELVRQRAREGR